MDEEVVILEQKLVLSLDEIRMNLESDVEISIKYNYSLFGTMEHQSPPFFVSSIVDENQKISAACGYWEHIIPLTKSEQEVENFLKEEPLQIELYEDNKCIGTVSVDLRNLIKNSPGGRKFAYEYFKLHELPIKSSNMIDIGSLSGFCVLEKEECIICKSCNDTFKISTIQKHISHSKLCKIDYSTEEMNVLKSKSTERKNLKQSAREWKRYDPDKRAERHLKSYDKEKRAAKYKQKRDEMKEKKIRYMNE